ncbi:MAG: hypothetical protein WB783_03635 [Arenicellales bacterium]
MTDDRRRILNMLAEGKISAEEADRLIGALGSTAPPSPGRGGEKPQPRYIRVLVDTVDPNDGPTKVNVRVPIQLLRAGVKLTGLIPADAREHMNDAMHKQGIDFDVNQIKPENLDELIDQLNDLTVDVDQADTKVKVFCE